MDGKYKNRLQKITEFGKVGVIVGIAKEVGIIDILKKAQKPLTSQEIADSKHLKERYVREMLGALATAELVCVLTNDEGKNEYYLDDEGKECLSGPLMAVMSFPLLMGRVSEQVLPCVPVDGPWGVKYGEWIFKFMDELRVYVCDTNVNKILELVPGLREKLENGINVVEFGSGSGRVLARFATMFPKSRFMATDIFEPVIEEMKSLWGHLPNMSFSFCDLSAIPDCFVDSYDWGVAFNVIHDLPHPQEVLKEIKRCLKKPDGLFTFWDAVGTGSHTNAIGDMRIASQYAASALFCIPESFQDENSVAYGACWAKQTAVDIATSAGYSATAFSILESEALVVCRLDGGQE